MPLYIKKYVNNYEDSKAYGKTYGRVHYMGTTEIDDMCAKIEEKCTVHSADIHAVLVALKTVVKEELHDGKRVKLPGLGTFKLGVNTKGEEKPEDFNFRDSILNVHVIFQPETTVENGHRVKWLVQGARCRELPKYEGLDPSDEEGGGGTSGGGGNGGNGGGGNDDPIETQP